MLTFVSELFTGLVAVLVTAILAAAEWYIWDSRYKIAAQLPPGPAPSAHHKDVIQVSSASARGVVVTLAA